MTILVTGTLAIDHIAKVADGFQSNDLNGKLHRPKVHWGGCGMNLTYALMRAGHSALPWVFYGNNCPPGYLQHLQDLAVDQRAMHKQHDALCAEAYIFTRDDTSQLTGFYPGSTRFEAPDAATLSAIGECSHWIAGPEDDATLLARLKHIPTTTTLYWMPGQYVDVTRNNVLQPMLERRPNIVVNETEWQTLIRNVGSETLDATIDSAFVTLGAKGVRYRQTAQDQWHEHVTVAANVVDPTGCGDSFCATLVGDLVAGSHVTQALDHAQRKAALCLGQEGAQRY